MNQVELSQQRWQEANLQPASYYVAEVSWGKQNPPHKVIIATAHHPHHPVEIFSRNYEDVEKVPLGKLHSFRVIAPIIEMNA